VRRDLLTASDPIGLRRPTSEALHALVDNEVNDDPVFEHIRFMGVAARRGYRDT
jgi:hypothetical protein